tara:strand:+ start:3609 stop:3896 length:288 start_codon:yes stop_codon:yes gene_type:complete
MQSIQLRFCSICPSFFFLKDLLLFTAIFKLPLSILFFGSCHLRPTLASCAEKQCSLSAYRAGRFSVFLNLLTKQRFRSIDWGKVRCHRTQKLDES